MKSRYIASKTESEKIAMQVARAEIERQKAELCPACEDRIGAQVLAVVCKVLHDEFGFGKARLQKVVTCTDCIFTLCAVDGETYRATQVVDWLRDTMGIDLEHCG